MFIHSLSKYLFNVNIGTYQVLGTVQAARSTRISQYGLPLTELSVVGSGAQNPTLMPPHTSCNRGECPGTAMSHPLTPGSTDFWRTQRAISPASSPMWLQEHPRHPGSLSFQAWPPSSEQLHFIDEKTEAPRQGNNLSRATQQ